MSGTIAFFPEGAYGPALNSVGIAQACRALGHRCVFIRDPGFTGVFSGYGFDEIEVALSEPMAPEEMARYWSDFINGHIPNFARSPYEQIGNYVKECWEAVVDTAKWAEKSLPAVLDAIQPDVVCVDNVILFPAVKRYCADHGKAWVRIISCSENEIPDPDIPPHLSGCSHADHECHRAFEERFNEVIAPIHADFNDFLVRCGESPYPLGQFFEPSPWCNLLLYPQPVAFTRRYPLQSPQYEYLEGCVRSDDAYEVPDLAPGPDAPLLYVSFGSLGAGDTQLLRRIIEVLARLPYRCLVNVGEYLDQYDEPPANVHLAGWYPQPSVIPQVDAVIHHGGNNSFTECLYFGKPALVLPYVWDGHDNATRVAETGHGLTMHRSDWADDQFVAAIEQLLSSEAMHARLAATSAHMRAHDGPTKAAGILDRLVQEYRG